MDRLKITYQSPAALEPRATNPRTHSKRQIRRIADSIERFGFNDPVLIDREGGIVAGHGRVEAAKLLGLESVPTIRFEDLSEAEIRAYVIADNRLAELAGWDRGMLAIELQGLLELDLDFEVTLTGFETPEIDILIGECQPLVSSRFAKLSEFSRREIAISPDWSCGNRLCLWNLGLQKQQGIGWIDSGRNMEFREDHLNLALNQGGILAEPRIDCGSRETASGMGSNRIQTVVQSFRNNVIEHSPGGSLGQPGDPRRLAPFKLAMDQCLL
jgi:hypothetical protein